MVPNSTICESHGVAGMHPNSPDCYICQLEKQVKVLKYELAGLQIEKAGLEIALADLKTVNANANAAKIVEPSVS